MQIDSCKNPSKYGENHSAHARELHFLSLSVTQQYVMVISPRMTVTLALVSVTGKKILVFTVSTALVLSVLLPLYIIPSLGGNGGLIHEDEHELGTAEAPSFPFEANRVYNVREIGGASILGSDPVIIHDNVVSGRTGCEFCTRIEYVPGIMGRTELSFASDKSYDLTGAKKVTFFVKGAEGDEVITVKAAGKKIVDQNTGKVSEIKYRTHSKPFKLEENWKRLEIDLGQGSLKDITNAFGVEINRANNNSDKPVVLYIKGILFEKSAAIKPLTAEALPPDVGNGN